MSIIVAVRKAGSTIVAADTMHLFGGRCEYPGNLVGYEKVRRIGRSLIGGVGHGAYDNIVEAYFGGMKRLPSLKDTHAVYLCFLKLWQAARDRYQMVTDRPDSECRSPFADLDSRFLVANKHGMFLISDDLAVDRFDRYLAIGCGGDFAYGALDVLYDTKRTAEQIAVRAVEACIRLDDGCGGAVEVYPVK